jgi:hypothetical protein
MAEISLMRMRFGVGIYLALILLSGAGLVRVAQADIVTVGASQDNSMFSEAGDTENDLSNGAGFYLFAGAWSCGAHSSRSTSRRRFPPARRSTPSRSRSISRAPGQSATP